MASPLSHDGTSREATPSTSSSHSGVMDRAVSSSASMGTSTQSQEDMDRFLKRMDMEKTIHALQARLELASVKASNGWKDMTIGEIETQLPQTPLLQRPPVSVVTERSTPTSPQIPYEPPSPSRPWQLIDVLWQPLPPPSNPSYTASPISPQKRSRVERHPDAPRPIITQESQSQLSGHRRSSSSVASPSYRYTDPYPSSPLRELQDGRKKRRSQSHSHHPRSETTRQDVDAAKALTSMLGSGSQESSETRSFMQAPLLPPTATTSLPLPITPKQHPPRSRASSVSLTPPRPPDLRTPSSHTRSRIEEAERGEEDKSAAELMMFLAHSPSPMKPSKPTAQTRAAGGAARVLFVNGGDPGGGRVTQHSNLGIVPPINAGVKEEVKQGGNEDGGGSRRT